MQHQYWRHATSGEVYAVEIDDDGHISSCIGPLHYSHVANVDDHDFSDGIDDAQWCEDNQDEFILHT